MGKNVLVLNGSPRTNGNTAALVDAFAEGAGQAGNDVVRFDVALMDIAPCRGCLGGGADAESPCVQKDDMDAVYAAYRAADVVVLASPMYCWSVTAQEKAVLDRLFYAASARLRFKPAAAVASARRAGTTPAIDQINKYFQINCMPVVSSNYWPMVHGRSVEDVRQDAEGLQIMRVLGTNMAWMLQATSAAPAPNVEQKITTSFIR